MGERFGIRRYSRLALEVAKDADTDVLHSHFGHTGWKNLELATRTGMKHVVTFYGLDVNYLPKHGWATRYQELFEQIDLVFDHRQI